MFKENLTDIKILIVEDEKNISNAEKKYLEVEGFQVDQAFDGQEAITMINTTDYSLIILDLMLPKVSGEKVMEVIRSRTETPESINLTSNEFQIIKTLFSNPNKIFTRDEIIELSFGYDYEAFDRAIDTHIKNIRHKIEDNPKKPRYIKTIYGVGYKLGVYDEA